MFQTISWITKTLNGKVHRPVGYISSHRHLQQIKTFLLVGSWPNISRINYTLVSLRYDIICIFSRITHNGAHDKRVADITRKSKNMADTRCCLFLRCSLLQRPSRTLERIMNTNLIRSLIHIISQWAAKSWAAWWEPRSKTRACERSQRKMMMLHNSLSALHSLLFSSPSCLVPRYSFSHFQQRCPHISLLPFFHSLTLQWTETASYYEHWEGNSH